MENNSKNGDDLQGGQGGDATLPSRSDCVLTSRAIRKHFPISPEYLAKIADRMAKIVLAPLTPQRNKIAAARVVVSMVVVDMEQEKRDLGIPDNVHVTFDDPISDERRAAEAVALLRLARARAADEVAEPEND